MKKWIFRLMMVLVVITVTGCESQQVKDTNSSIQGAEKSPADVYVSLGVEYMYRGMNDVALEKLKSAITIDSFSSNAHNVLAVLSDRLGEQYLAGKNYK